MNRRPYYRKKLGGVTISVQKCRKPGYAAIAVMREHGRRTREEYFETISAAKSVAEAWSIEAGNVGASAAASITEADKRLIQSAKARLLPFRKTVSDAVDFYVLHLHRQQTGIDVRKLVNQFLDHKEREGVGDRHQQDIRQRLERFAQAHENISVGSVSTKDVSRWLTSLNLSPVSVGNFRRTLSNFFGYAVTSGVVEVNPVTSSFKPKVRPDAIGIVSVDEAAALLREAAKEPEILPAVVLGIFAGIRDAELKRLTWLDVNLKSCFITLNANITKTTRRRLIPIRPALLAWLGSGGKGPIWPGPTKGRRLWRDVRERAGFKDGHEWPHNALRHSFASYHLAAFQDAPALALEMGNSVDVILRHYRELVLPVDGQRFWNLTPEAVAHA